MNNFETPEKDAKVETPEGPFDKFNLSDEDLAQVKERGMTVEQVEANIKAGKPAPFREFQDPKASAKADSLASQRDALNATIQHVWDEGGKIKRITMSPEYFKVFWNTDKLTGDYEQMGVKVEVVEDQTDQYNLEMA